MNDSQRFSTLAQWLHWQESLHFNDIEMGLERVGCVARAMGLIDALPSSNLCFSSSNPRVITVAGTNGKGSCVASLEQLLLQQGFSVGAYTSPHFLHYCERIRINGKPAPEGEVCAAFAAIDKARNDTSLTYFEFGTLAGLEVFRQHNVDFVLLEVGLGGRLDAVNIIDADVAVITSIALDHEDWLGSDLDVIAAEKAGIVRARRPVISTVQQSARAISKTCAAVGAELHQYGQSFEFQRSIECWSLQSQDYAVAGLPLPSLPLPSVAAAILALRHFQVKFTQLQLTEYLPQLSLPGRFQKVSYRGREVILDVAHNPAAAEFLAERLSCRKHVGRVHALMAIMADKDITAVIKPLLSCVQHWVATSLPGNSRAALAEDLLQNMHDQGACVVAQSDVVSGFNYLLKNSAVGDTLLVIGSFFTVAEVLAILASDVESQNG